MASSDYAVVDDIGDRLVYTFPDGFSASTKPTRDRVEKWIEEAEALLNNCLNAANIATPITNSNGRIELGKIVSDHVEGRIRMLLAAAGGDGDNDDGQVLAAVLALVCDDIRDNQVWWGDKLASGSGGARQLFGHPTDDVDGRTIAAGDFAPKFTKDDVF